MQYQFPRQAYIEYLNLISTKEKVQTSETRKQALLQAKQCALMLVQTFSVTRVIVFGSLLKEESFDDCSDIDLAVEGLPDYFFIKAITACMEHSSFSIDLIPLENASPDLRQYILENGRTLFPF
ncbi:MAG: hypothetical protein JW795_20325 [Chitinivibrionales bacterium]|nr:hypothetical protein [Chitinivibrionales bacterium]